VTKQSKRSIWGLVKLYPIFALFIASYTVVHLIFEYNFWFTSGDAIFGKYAEAGHGNALLVAQKVYFTKATWMFALVWLLVLRVPLRAAITYSFFLYSVELLLLFETRTYLVLNLLLSLGMLVELWVKRGSATTQL
jgi:hypothetical protein